MYKALRRDSSSSVFNLLQVFPSLIATHLIPIPSSLFNRLQVSPYLFIAHLKPFRRRIMLFAYLLLWAVALGQANAARVASNTTKPSDLVRSQIKPSPSSTTTAVRTATSSAWSFQYTGNWVNDPCNTIYKPETFYAKWNGSGTPGA